MNPVTIESESWSGPRWTWTIVALLLLQAALVTLLSKRPPPKTTGRPAHSRIEFADSLESRAGYSELVSLQDPDAFARVHDHGFSPAGWIRAPRLNYQVTNSTESLHWLEPSEQHLADDFREFVAATFRPSVFGTEKPEPAAGRILVTGAAFPTQAVVRIEGSLARRRILATPAPPENEATVLTNTVIRLAVDDTGRTLSTTLLVSSGSANADQKARTHARQTRFAPQPPAGPSPQADPRLEFGEMIFQWFVPLPAGPASAATSSTTRP